MNTVELFLAHAIQLEREAARRYEDLAATTATDGNAELKEFFTRMAHFSRLHLADAMARGGFRELPVLSPEEFSWPEGVALTLAHFCSPKHPIRFRKGCFRPHMPTIRAILSIGVANFAMLFCASFVNAFYNFGLSRYGGDYAVAAFGIANTIGALLVMVIMGISIGVQPVAGFNFGARSFSRVREAVRYALLAAVGVATLGFVMAQLLPRVLAHAFTTDSRLIEETVASMPLLFAVFPVVGFQIVISSLFQSIGKAKVSVVLGLSRQCLFLLPALAILPRFFGLRGVWCAAPVTDLLSALLAAVAYKKMLPRYLNQEDEI